MVFEIPLTTENDPLLQEGKGFLDKGEYTKARETFDVSYKLRAKNYGEESQEALEALLYLSIAYSAEENIEKGLEDAYSFLSRNPEAKRQILICKYIIGQTTCQIPKKNVYAYAAEAKSSPFDRITVLQSQVLNVE